MATQATSIPMQKVRPSTVPANSESMSMTTGQRVVTASAGRNRRLVSASADTEGEEEDFGWPELPPIFQFRMGIARENVGRGVEYVLPVDKGRLSMENRYRVDLRAMFQMPYMQVSRVFDDARIHAVNSLHLRPNTIHSPDRRPVSRLIASFAHKANDDIQLRKVSASLSEAPKRAVENYCNTSPDNRPLFTPERMETRSKLFLPFHAAGAVQSTASSEARAKAESILRELNIAQDVLGGDNESQLTKKPEEREKEKRSTKEPQADDTTSNKGKPRRTERQSLTRLKNIGIKSYDDLKRLGATFRPDIPEDARSPFLDAETNAKIWQWLTDKEAMSEFDYFMVLCD